MSGAGNLTLSKPLGAHFGPSSDAPFVCKQVMKGHCLHVCLSLKPKNKCLPMATGYLCHFC